MHISHAEVFDSLSTKGFFKTECDSARFNFDDLAIYLGRIVGAKTIGAKSLYGTGSSEYLSIHTESITQEESSILGYFALACCQPSNEGGETILYNGLSVAEEIETNYPELAKVKIEYRSTVYENQTAIHTLITPSVYGNTIRYRSQEATNRIVEGLPAGVSESDFYRTVDRLVAGHVVVEHSWRSGEFIIVNNLITLHSRAPYTGDRGMIRYRYDDPHFKHIEIGAEL